MSNKTNPFTRRDFVKSSSLAMAAIPFLSFSNTFSASEYFDENELSVNIFSKHLHFLDYTAMSEAAAEIGFDGLDLTVRPDGHVDPERVAEDLPRATEALKKAGLKPQMITTNVSNAEDPLNRTLLKTAGEQDFEYYRMGWLKYPEEQSIPETISIYQDQFKALAKYNKEVGLQGSYQNHSGEFVGAPIWDLYQILNTIPVSDCGVQYDIRHATLEGTNAWELGLKLIKDHINTIVIKDFKWESVNGKPKIKNTPLGEGMVDFPRYFSLLKKYKINVPVSLHLEYELGGAEHGNKTLTIDKKEVFKNMKKDLQFLRESWANVE